MTRAVHDQRRPDPLDLRLTQIPSQETDNGRRVERLDLHPTTKTRSKRHDKLNNRASARPRHPDQTRKRRTPRERRTNLRPGAQLPAQ